MSLYGMPQMIADQPVWSPLQGLMPGIEQGANVGLKAQHAHAALLQNRLLEQQAKTQPQLVQAQIARLNAQAQGTGAGLPPGVAGQWAQLEKYKQQFGENSPEYQQLYHALAAQQHMSAQRGNYYAALANTIGQRYSPTQQKQQIYTSLLKLGYPVTTINTLNDAQRAHAVAYNVPYSHYAAALAQQQGGTPTSITQAQTPGLPSANQLPQGRTLDASAQPITQAPQIGAPPLQPSTTQAPQIGVPSDVAQALAPQPSTTQATQIGLPQSPSAMINQSGMLGAGELQQANQQRIKQLAAEQAQQAQSAVFKTTTTTDQQNRLAGAARAIPSLQMMSENAPLALQYAGIAGKSKKLAAKLRQSNSPSYLAYKQYKQAQAIAEQDTALALGIKATDKAFDAYKPLFNVDSWDVNPQQASALFNNMTTLIHKESQKNAMTLQQQRQLIRGSSPAQVPGRTSAQAPTAPTFQNKQKFLSWYNGLSNAQQHAYKQSQR